MSAREGGGPYSDPKWEDHGTDEFLADGWNKCLYCGELVRAPSVYCCEEHAQGWSGHR